LQGNSWAGQTTKTKKHRKLVDSERLVYPRATIPESA
jgi:hypothetical protein